MKALLDRLFRRRLTSDQQALYTAVVTHARISGTPASVLLPDLARQLDATTADQDAVARQLGVRR